VKATNLLQIENFTTRKKANLVFYSLNKSYLLFAELKSIVSKTIGVTASLQDVLRSIKGVETAFIYGSFAKSNEKSTSDIDLFIIGNISKNALIRAIKELESTLKREINYTLYTRSEFMSKKRKKDSFIIDLLENPKIMLIEEDGLR
jgi:predicted nucleotidyltransferase